VKKKIILSLLVVFVGANSQNVKILSGVQVEGKPTKIVFESEDGDAVNVYQVGGYSSSIGTIGVGTNTTLTTNMSTQLSLLVTAPATIEVDKGELRLQISESAMFAYPFTIKATGGTQYWKVRNASGLWYLEAILACSLGIVGGAFASVGLSNSSTPLALAGFIMAPVGVGGFVYGVYRSSANAKLINVEF